MRYFLEIAYDGSEFSGWQIQPNQRTVQGTIETALQTIYQQSIPIVGCGRTDTGVHASQFYLHFDLPNIQYDNLIYKLNSLLPDSIVVNQLIPVAQDAHARFDATSRSYVYSIHLKKTPFLPYSHYCHYNLNIKAMQSVANILTNYSDFAALSKWNEDVKSSICHIHQSELVQINQHQLEYRVTANRFLHNMIRRIMGLLMNVGRGKIDMKTVVDVLNNYGTFSLNSVAPANGLCLTSVTYNYISNG